MAPHDLFAAAPELMKKWAATSLATVSSLEPSLIHLVEIRASQINGCANCINMHTQEARAKGETEQRMYLLSGGPLVFGPRTTLMINVINGWNRISLCPLSEASRRRSAFVHKSAGLGCRAGVLWPLYIPLAAPTWPS